MSITYAVAGVALDDSAGRWKLLKATQIGTGASLRTSDLQIPGMDGSIAPAREPRDVPLLVLQVRIYGSTDAEMDQRYSGLLAVLSPTSDVTVTRTVDGTARTATARGKTVSQPEYSSSRHTATITATLRLTEVYWRADAGDWSQSNPTSGTAYEVTTLADSTGPINDALVLLTGPMSSGAQVKCNGEWFKVGSAIVAGSKALIDCKSWTVRIGTDVSFTGGGTVTPSVLTNSGGSCVLPLVPAIQSNDPTDTKVKVTLVAAGMSSSSAIGVRARTAQIA